jgi:hypothetical protein
MQHNLRNLTKLATAALLVLSSMYSMTENAMAQPPRSIDGHISLCGRTNIPVRVYAADRYYARPLVCGGGPVNSNENPDFQLTRGDR